DLTAEVFLRLVEKIADFTYRGRPILAWLYTIARNLLTDYHRRHKVEEQVEEADRWASAADPSRTVERRLERECLGRALRRLNDTYQQVIVLRFVQGLSHAQTAAILGKSENATKVLQHRALRSLRKALKSEGCYEA
ncbi:MAG TPA: sigma-70 family RNA polymerase sigma factor, partial [Anaerolineae bacterium]|nr:sigma-70 family RNA polymerase sigma factor [Anaerolineae bacterium]